MAEAQQLTLWDPIVNSPLAAAAFMLAVSSLLFSFNLPLPRSFIVTLLAATALVLAAFLSSSIKSYRYIFPVVLAWEALLPLFLLRLSRQSRRFNTRPFRYATMLLLSGAYLVLQIYSLLLPQPVYI